MELIPTALNGVAIIEPKVFGDARGFFYESFNEKRFLELAGLDATNPGVHFVQDNHSKSANKVLRGLHYQIQQAQGKLVRVIAGEVFDVAVDIRKSSPTFGKWVGVTLSADNQRQLWIPAGFAHGFCVLSEKAHVLYKATDYYSPEHERTVIWNDSDLKIKWELDVEPIVSAKDQRGVAFRDAESFD